MGKLRKSARYRDCQVRFPGVCNHNPETVVLAHMNGGGMGMKHPDLFGAFACSDCHDVIDGRRQVEFTHEELELWFLHGVLRTQKIWLDEGLVWIS